MIGHCSSSDTEQLSYGETRLECLTDLNIKIEDENGTEFMDKMRFFKGVVPQWQWKPEIRKMATCSVLYVVSMLPDQTSLTIQQIATYMILKILEILQ